MLDIPTASLALIDEGPRGVSCEGTRSHYQQSRCWRLLNGQQPRWDLGQLARFNKLWQLPIRLACFVHTYSTNLDNPPA